MKAEMTRSKGVQAQRWLRRWWKLLNPFPPVGGLEVNDTEMRFARIDEGKFVLASLRLPPGLIAGGVIKDRANVVGALKNLHEQVAPAGTRIHVVLILPSERVSLQPFTLPALSGEQLFEAARLNLEMISPIAAEDAFASYEVTDATLVSGHQIECLGAFTERTMVADFAGACEEAGFRVVAVEFPVLALVRAIHAFGAPSPKNEPYFLAYVGETGLSLAIVRHERLVYAHFRSWVALSEEVGGREITDAELRAFIQNETRRVLHFYTSRWGGTLAHAVIVPGGLGEMLRGILTEQFGFTVHTFGLKDASEIEEAWFSVLGSAWRGLIPRANDRALNLAAETVAANYRADRLQSFTALWWRVGFLGLGLVTAVFIGGDAILAHRERSVARESQALPYQAELEEIRQLVAAAHAFNALVSQAVSAAAMSIPWSPRFEAVRVAAGETVVIRSFVMGEDGRAEVEGTSVNEASALAFKNRLLQNDKFRNILLPLTDLKVRSDGSVDFTIRFEMKAAP